MKKMKKILALAVWIAALGLLCASCDNGLDIQQAYTFSLETMPVQKRISVGETAEIRCTLVREGRYDGARYTIRYFQPDGRGELRMDDGTVFLPNDRYLLENEKFRLYYTAEGDEAHNFIVVVEDNFNNSYELEFDFNNRNVKDDGVISVVPIRNFKPLTR